MPRPVWVAVYDPGDIDAEVIGVATDRAKLEAAVEEWGGTNCDRVGAVDIRPEGQYYVDIREFDLIE